MTGMRVYISVLVLVIMMAGQGFAMDMADEGMFDDGRVRAFDTVTHSDLVVSSYEIRTRKNWQPVDLVSQQIEGDLCIENNRLCLFVRKGAEGIEAYYKLDQYTLSGAEIYPVGAWRDAAEKIKSYELTMLSSAETRLHVVYETEQDKTLQIDYVVKGRSESLEIIPGDEAVKVVVRSRGRYVVLPDLFADDVVFDMNRQKEDSLYLPGDSRVMLQMIDEGRAIVACNWLLASDQLKEETPVEDDEPMAELSRQTSSTTVTELPSPDQTTSTTSTVLPLDVSGVEQNKPVEETVSEDTWSVVDQLPVCKNEILIRLVEDDKRMYTETVFRCEQIQKLWLSFMARKSIWFGANASRFTIYDHIPLEWVVPFSAHWRADLTRVDAWGKDLTDSFWNVPREAGGVFKPVPMLLGMKIIDGQYIVSGEQEEKRLVRHSVINEYTGNGWWTHRGWFIQPFFIEGVRAFLKLPVYEKSRSIRYGGTILFYPLLSNGAMFSNPITVENILENTLGPNYLEILDLAELNKRPEKDYYPPTCTTTEYCEKIIDTGNDQLMYRFIESILGEMQLFVRYSNQRLHEYLDWNERLALLTKAYEHKSSAMDKAISEVNRYSDQIQRKRIRENKQTPIPDQIDSLVKRVLELLEKDHRSKEMAVKKLFKQIRTVGNTQDELLGQYREILRAIRQRVTLLHSLENEPEVREYLRQVRLRTEEILRIHYDMEGK